MARRVKTPTVLQMEALECGAAALAMVLGYFGRFVPLEKLRMDCGISKDGSSAANILRGARQHGLIAKGYKKEVEELQTVQFPAILFWEFNHFVVLEGVRRGNFYINDPASGPRSVSKESFAQSFTGIVLEFERGPDFVKSGSPRSFFESAVYHVHQTRSAMTFLVLCSLLLVVIGISVPIFFRVVVDELLIQQLRHWMAPIFLGFAGLGTGRILLIWLRERVRLRTEINYLVTLASRYYWHVLRLPMIFFDHRYTADISGRVFSNLTIARFFPEYVITLSFGIFAAIIYTAILFQYDWQLTLAGGAIVGAAVILARWLGRHEINNKRKIAAESSKGLSTIMGGLFTIENIKAMGVESEFFGRWAGFDAKLINATQKYVPTSALNNAATAFFVSLFLVAILFVGSNHILDGQMTPGMLAAVLILAFGLLQPLGQVGLAVQKSQELDLAIKRIDDVMNYPVSPRWQNDAADVDPAAPLERLVGRVEIKNLSFGYDRFKKPIIDGFNLSVKPGQRVAIIGATGSGKSSVAKLLAGLYEPWSGEIVFGDHPIDTVPREIFVNDVGYVSQDIQLLEGTVKDNLTMWEPSVTEDQMMSAAMDAAIHDDIMALPQGYDSAVDPGGRNLSGGQRQRLDIARALVLNPPILILDEAMSALDSLTEQRIDSNLRKRGCSLIIISHRLSTVRDCDLIVCIDQGRIVEQGTHEELLKGGSFYRALIEQEA